jgi:xanthine dehydrogenase accessory factor
MHLLDEPQIAGRGQEPIAVARAWLAEFERIAMATVVATWGSAPVPVGSQLVVAPDERFEGSVSGGCVEADVLVEAAGVIASGGPKLLEFGVSDETAWRAGLPCGGTIEIFVEPLEAARDAAELDRMLTARRERRALVVATRLADGSRRTFGRASDAPPEIAEALQSGVSRVVGEADARVFLHARAPVVHVILIGATHAGQVLADLARRVGYRVSVVDPRSAFATADRFADVERHAAWPEASLESLGLDAHTAVVALTHVAHIDDEALSLALRSDCFYIGALGSRRTHARRIERLAAAGLDQAALARIHAPVGLAIGAQGPAEIAVSILAEIVKTRRGA